MKPLPEHQRKMAIKYAWNWIGTPYLWGGDDFSGFDCSGFVVEILQATGVIKHKTDYSANGLYKLFKGTPQKPGCPQPGCLVFWMSKALGERIAIHVEFLIDECFVIGASGGGSRTKTVADAIRDNAFIKMRPINYRGEDYIILDPFIDD